MHFGKELQTLQHEPWAAHYLDYAALKAMLERPPAVDHHDPDHHTTNIMDHATTGTTTTTATANDNNNTSAAAAAVVDDHMSVETGHTTRSSSRWTLTSSTHLIPQAAEFLTVLHGQLEKIILFVLQEEGRVAIELAANRNAVWQVYTEAEFRTLYHAFRETGRHLLHLIQFVDVNVTGIRKIVKKFDKKNLQNHTTPMATRFWSSSSASRLRASRLVQPLLKQNDSLGALQMILETGMEELRDHYYQIYNEEALLLLRTAPQQQRKQAQQQQQHQQRQHQHARTLSAPAIPPAVITKDVLAAVEDTMTSALPPGVLPPPPPPSSPLLTHFPKQQQQQQATPIPFSDLIPRSPRPMPPRRGRNSVSRSSFSSALGLSSPSLGISSASLFGPDFAAAASLSSSTWTEPILLQIYAARQRLADQTNEFVHLLAAPMLMGDMALEGDGKETRVEKDDDQIDEFHYLTGEAAELEPVDSTRAISSLLNLLSTFLYMTNYYIVTPTSTKYAAKLGGSESEGALIIGMTPIAALVSTILFSWWTNHSYKAALVFASSCSLLGNLLYALGMPCNSLGLVMVGRLLNGFGSARSINRRYIADTFTRDERTAASAAFVTAGALGMAAGPAVAAFLHTVAPDDGVNTFWQAENSPGWFMAVIWTAYLVAMFLYFRDPPKKLEPSVIEMKGEKTPLLKNGNQSAVPLSSDDSFLKQGSSQSLLRNVPVMTTFLIYFVLKLVLEALLSSSANLTYFYFGWDGGATGVFLACVGLLMLPANLGVAWLAGRYDDRELIVAFQGFMFLGCLAIMKYGPVYSLLQYLIASVIIFVSTNALEGPNMSLLSNTIPKSWSRGIFNVGLLATEAGTAGRALGNVFLSSFGSGGIENLLNRTFGSFSALSGATLVLTLWLYEDLDPVDKDD